MNQEYDWLRYDYSAFERLDIDFVQIIQLGITTQPMYDYAYYVT